MLQGSNPIFEGTYICLWQSTQIQSLPSLSNSRHVLHTRCRQLGHRAPLLMISPSSARHREQLRCWEGPPMLPVGEVGVVTTSGPDWPALRAPRRFSQDSSVLMRLERGKEKGWVGRWNHWLMEKWYWLELMFSFSSKYT